MLDATACRPAPEVATVLGQDDLLAWFQSLSIPEPTCSLIDHIRSSGPSRRVGGGRSNVSGRYPSRKMGVTIQFESHRIELAGIYEMEHDAAVLEYFDQPPAIKLDYESVAEKRVGKNGRPRKNCVDSTCATPIVMLLEAMSRGVARPAKHTQNGWGSIIVSAPRQRLTGCFSGTFSLWKITCGPI